MALITVTHEYDDHNNFQFHVEVRGRKKTSHYVTIDRPYYDNLTAGRVSMKKLIEESFVFLLEKESNTDILRSFNLREIEHFFPEYPNEMKKLGL